MDMTRLSNITVLGTGVLGSQIAFQTAFSGFEVVAWDVDDAALEAAKVRFRKLLTATSAKTSKVPRPARPRPRSGVCATRPTSPTRRRTPTWSSRPCPSSSS